MAALGEAGNDTIYSSKAEAVAFVAGFEWLHQDYIGVQMTGEHNEVVSTSGANREPSHVISVKIADGFCCDVELL